jgi:hypothetical protein
MLVQQQSTTRTADPLLELVLFACMHAGGY